MWSKNGFIRSIEKIENKDEALVLFSGCPLRCLYCDVPDLWKASKEEMKSLDDAFKDILSLNVSKVLISGGEPLSQPQFLISLLKMCKENNIKTTIDTSGFGNAKHFETILKYTDLVIFDLKETDAYGYHRLTGVNKRISDQFVKATEKLLVPLIIKTVIVPGSNNRFDVIDDLALEINKLSNVKTVELIPYHNHSVNKYQDLNLDYKLKDAEPMKDAELSKLSKYLNEKLIYKKTNN